MCTKKTGDDENRAERTPRRKFEYGGFIEMDQSGEGSELRCSDTMRLLSFQLCLNPQQQHLKECPSRCSTMPQPATQHPGLPRQKKKLQCGARTDDEQFDQMWWMESLKVNRLTSSSQLKITPHSAPPAEAERRGTKRKRKRSRSRSRRGRTPSSQVLLPTPDHPRHINIETLANTQNHFHYMEFKRKRFVRVTASVPAPVGQQGPSTWRVSDYNLEGSKIRSVFCTMITDRIISGSEETRQEEQEGSRMAT
ncbi:hypothetical protein EYF80_007775 [Liparis tanakae]|uniref:Uncharacterized protein n=1 Tax=Liparis tanakae TaxID=230148 RepID=A0A4Z2IVV3_9TELE|nr:hypothetical protein EYF80_007775 [Liparis tanakae]